MQAKSLHLSQLDADVASGLQAVEDAHTIGELKAKLSSGSWVAGAFALLLIAGLIGYATLKEYAFWQMHQRTCEGVLLSGDAGKMEFLSKHCVSR